MTALYALAGKRPAHGNHPALFSLHLSPLPRLLQSRASGFSAWSPRAVCLPPIRVTIAFAGSAGAVIRLAIDAAFGRAHGWPFTSGGASLGKNGHFAGHEPGYTVKVIIGPLSGRMTGPPRINPVRICQFAGCGQFQNRSQCGSSFAVFLPDKT